MKAEEQAPKRGVNQITITLTDMEEGKVNVSTEVDNPIPDVSKMEGQPTAAERLAMCALLAIQDNIEGSLNSINVPVESGT